MVYYNDCNTPYVNKPLFIHVRISLGRSNEEDKKNYKSIIVMSCENY